MYCKMTQYMCVPVCVLSCIWLFATPWTVAHQAPPSMEFPSQEYWSGCHHLLQGIFPKQGSKPRLLCLLCWQADTLPLCCLESPSVPFSCSVMSDSLQSHGLHGKPIYVYIYIFFKFFSEKRWSHYRLSQYIESSSLCYTVGPCWLLYVDYYIVVCIIVVYMVVYIVVC